MTTIKELLTKIVDDFNEIEDLSCTFFKLQDALDEDENDENVPANYGFMHDKAELVQRYAKQVRQWAHARLKEVT